MLLLSTFDPFFITPSQYKLEPIIPRSFIPIIDFVSVRPLIPRPTVFTLSLSIIDPFFIAPSQRKLKPVSLRPFIPIFDTVSVAQISRPLISILFSSLVDIITIVSQNSRLSKLLVSAPHVIGPQLFYLTPGLSLFLVSGNQTPLLPILFLGDIPVVSIASFVTDNLSLSGIYSRRRRPHMLVFGAQS